MPQFQLQGTVAARRESVWRVFTDHRGWERWAGVKEVVLRQEGDPPPNGLGAIRVIRSRGIAIEEEITAFDAPKRMAYRLVGGAPVKNHQADVTFEPSESGTRVIWNVRFDPLIPFTGALLAGMMRRGLQDVLDRLARVEFED
jgi:uncharacterized protein YndB with AHSA1/START domain